MTTEIKMQIYGKEEGKFGIRYLKGGGELGNKSPKDFYGLARILLKQMGEGDFSKIYSLEYTEKASKELDTNPLNKEILEGILNLTNNIAKNMEKRDK